MSCNILIQTKVQLRAIIAEWDIVFREQWKKVGPCGDFIETPAVKFRAGDTTYIVLMSKTDFDEFFDIETTNE
jgi:hypothetical protein